MAPEFVMDGVFSVKSDVFSFGVLLIEILGGKRNGALYLEEHEQTLIQDVRTIARKLLSISSRMLKLNFLVVYAGMEAVD
jgi:serine/threonine protein kinase